VYIQGSQDGRLLNASGFFASDLEHPNTPPKKQSPANAGPLLTSCGFTNIMKAKLRIIGDEKMIETTINAQTVNHLKEKELARMIKNMVFDGKYTVQIFNFFTDVPLQDVEKFITEHRIPEETLKTYYETYVKEFYPNPRLEEMLGYAGVEEALQESRGYA
jgi:hypothetical protein